MLSFLSIALLFLSCSLSYVTCQSNDTTVTMWTYFKHENVDVVVNALTNHSKSVTRISVIAYMADIDGTFQCMYDQNNQPRDCTFYLNGIAALRSAVPQMDHLPTISLPPGYKGDGLRMMLANATMQQVFIQDALNEAIKQGYKGFNIDWETYYDEPSFLSFVTAFSTALHAKGLILTFDSEGVTTDILNAGMDRINDMALYGQTGNTLKNSVLYALSQIKQQQYCVGVNVDTPDNPVATDMPMLISLGIRHLCIWEDDVTTISESQWDAMQAFAYPSQIKMESE